jgi:succinate dehydrogenase / fumarate reductase membrane anchor subunit
MKSIRTPLGEVRGLGAAGKGTHEFIVQRLTSVALVLQLTGFLVLVVALNGEPYETVVAAVGSPFVAMLLVSGVLVTVVHMRIGMQVIIEDYVHTEATKFALLILNWLFAWAIGLIAVFAVLKIALAGG